MAELKRYGVMPAAGKYVAGMPNPGVGSVLNLTKQQAAHEVRLGTLKLLDEEAPAKAADDKGGDDTVAGGASDKGAGDDKGGDKVAETKKATAKKG